MEKIDLKKQIKDIFLILKDIDPNNKKVIMLIDNKLMSLENSYLFDVEHQSQLTIIKSNKEKILLNDLYKELNEWYEKRKKINFIGVFLNINNELIDLTDVDEKELDDYQIKEITFTINWDELHLNQFNFIKNNFPKIIKYYDLYKEIYG